MSARGKAAKTVTATIKLLIPAAGAKPAPPVGPALGQAGLNIMSFCKDFNAKTSEINVSCQCLTAAMSLQNNWRSLLCMHGLSRQRQAHSHFGRSANLLEKCSISAAALH